MTDDGNKPRAEPEFDRRQLIKLAIELGPLIAFFIAYMKADLITATGVLMATTLASLVASKILLGHVATMPIVTAVLVCVFGALTVWLQDATFIKMKPTILYLMFAGALAGGLLLGKLFLKLVLGEAMKYSDEGWRILTWRWAAFFVFLAVANEAVWRNFSETTWVSFKTFGFLPLTMAFAIAQFILMKTYETEAK
ncbi:MAG: septation protein A [Hyphomicrobium sp.]